MAKRINSPDTAADINLRRCLDTSPCISFNMIAGAGSGKTTSLVKALHHIISTQESSLKKQGQKIACITYTEIAAKEIWEDVGNNPLAHVSTIHSFLWTVIQPFQKDIKKWVLGNTVAKIEALQEKIVNYSPLVQQRTKDREAKQLERLRATSLTINNVPFFNYGTGSNYAKGVLGHDDIIKLVPQLIEERTLLNTILSQKYPYVFIDESQDTFPNIVHAFKKIDQQHSGKFCLGFFGDPMQKIYPTGIGEIPVEENWEIIKKPENFRCSKSVLDLINNIRKQSDGLEQTGGRCEVIEGKPEIVQGSAQIFILPTDDHREENLSKVKQWCSDKFKDEAWKNDNEIKVFVIVHRMAAIRLGFPNLYAAMNDNSPSSFKDGFLDGTSWPLKPFLNFILPLVKFNNESKKFEVAALVRSNSVKLMGESLKNPNLPENMKALKGGVDILTEMMAANSQATVIDVLKLIQEKELATLDRRLVDHINGTVLTPEVEKGEENPIDAEIESMKLYFACPATELWGYKTYFEKESPFATQQGVKGAEFERVITILDDEEGTHNQFSYDKLFGVDDLSKIDLDNIQQGKD
ncbi:MAG: ATP-dependent helicase, partial [Sphingobacteriales bacterium]